MKLLLLGVCCILAVQALDSVTVFQHGEGGFPCIRIPAVARCQGTLHAFAECRTRIGDGCVPAASMKSVAAGVCYKNSSDDGATWSMLTVVVTNAIQPTVVCEQQTQTLLLQFNMDGGNWQTTSKDNGGTWSKPNAINLGKYNGTDVGPGRGLQLSASSPTPQRVLFIGHHGAYQYDVVWYSDDGGKSYTVAETLLDKMDEAQLVELPGGQVMANMRNDHLSSCKCRAVAVSSDGGKTFGNINYDTTLISPVCMATILSMSNGSLVFANPASSTDREHGEVRRSDNGGQSWPYSWLVTTGAYAYSCLTHVADSSQVGLLWETSAEGCTGPSCQILFSKIAVM